MCQRNSLPLSISSSALAQAHNRRAQRLCGTLPIILIGEAIIKVWMNVRGTEQVPESGGRT
jgi:hypothetical protein